MNRTELLDKLRNEWEGSIHGWKLSPEETQIMQELETVGLVRWVAADDVWKAVDVH